MKVGMNLPVMVPGLDRDTLLEWARRVDEGPFATLAAGERINFPNPEIMVTLSAAAAATTRVKLACTVIVLPMHPALLMAKQIATLDVISSGRVVLGVGVGARADDYAAVGAPFDRRRLRRMEAQVRLMRRAWAGEIVVEGATRPIEPFPVQRGGPPILVAALAADSIKRAAAWADGLCGFSFGPSPAEVELAWTTARAAWQAAGRPAPQLTTSCWFALGPRARAQLDEYLQCYLGFLGADVARQLAPTVKTDSPQRLREILRQLADLGTDELHLVPTTMDAEEIARVADLLG